MINTSETETKKHKKKICCCFYKIITLIRVERYSDIDYNSRVKRMKNNGNLCKSKTISKNSIKILCSRCHEHATPKRKFYNHLDHNEDILRHSSPCTTTKKAPFFIFILFVLCELKKKHAKRFQTCLHGWYLWQMWCQEGNKT